MSQEEAVPMDQSDMLEAMIDKCQVFMVDDLLRSQIAYEVNCNDLWSWAFSDSEDLPYSEIQPCYRLGPITWACIRRGERPFAQREEQMKKAGEWNALLGALPERNQRG